MINPLEIYTTVKPINHIFGLLMCKDSIIQMVLSIGKFHTLA